MGMFDKDEFFNAQQLDEWVDAKEPFILWAVALTPSEINTSVGPAFGGILDVSPMNAPDNRVQVSTFASSIVDRIRDAEDSDFPAIVEKDAVPGSYGKNATILRFVGKYNRDAKS